MNTLIPISIKVVICWLFAGYLLVDYLVAQLSRLTDKWHNYKSL